MSIPGVFYGGGCSYMACHGCAVGAIRGALLLTHGPTGCRYYSGINSLRERGIDQLGESYRGRIFSTDLEEEDIVFGGEEKLSHALDEVVELFHPSSIIICTTCPVGLIGDDVQRVARLAAERHDIDILPISCGGFEPEPGWLTGTRELMNNWVGTETGETGPFPIHFMSESYSAMGKRVIGGLLERLGYDVVCSMMGETSCDEIRRAQQARLIVLDSNKEIDAVPAEMALRYGAGFFHVRFTGIANIDESLRHMASFFDDKGLIERTERLIEGEHARIASRLEEYRERLGGITAAVFEDIFRSDAFATLSDELGMEVIMTAQDFTATEMREDGFTVNISPACFERLESSGISFDYETRIIKRQDGRVWFDLDRTGVSQMLTALQPQLCFAGIEEQFSYHDAAIRSESFTSDDRGVGYWGYDGIFRYGDDVEMARFMSHWVTEPPTWATFRDDGEAVSVSIDDDGEWGAGA